MIFFLGNLYNYKFLKKNKNNSAAASEWKLSFIYKLQIVLKKKIQSLQYYECKPWPFDSLNINKKSFSSFKKTKYLSYLNLPIVKYFSLKKKIIEFTTAKNKDKKNIIFTYNFSKIDTEAALYLKDFFSYKWILICADLNQRDYHKAHKLFKLCDTVIFLSYATFKKYKLDNKVFYNGSSTFLKKNPRSKIKNFLYSGSLGNWIDIENFLENFCKIKDKNIKLYITSNNSSDKIDSFLNKDPRIKFLGFLDKKKYNILIKKIDCFVSVRDTKNKDNKNNFPSKIIKYLSYGIPIISSDMNNIPNSLKEILIIKKKYETYQDLIERVLKYSKLNINTQITKILKYNKVDKIKKKLILNKMIKKLDINS